MRLLLLHVLLAIPFTAVSAEDIRLDERPAGSMDWGYRPAAGSVSPVTPPTFCWRPQSGIVRWELR